MLFSIGAMEQDAQSIVQDELVCIVVQQDMRESALAINRMIALGEAAVVPLSVALNDSRTDLRAKWAVAQALGEIGSANGLGTSTPSVSRQLVRTWKLERPKLYFRPMTPSN